MATPASSLWPREHGAYAQLGIALLAGAVLGHGFRGISQALLTLLLFLASEPVLVILGRRGGTPRDANRVRAALRLLILGSLILLAAGGAWAGAPAAHFAGILPAAILGAALFALFLFKLERTAAGELLAAWTFSAAAYAVALLGGAGAHKATILAFALAAMFTEATAVVHLHLVALKRSANWPRFLAVLLGLALAGIALALSRPGMNRAAGASLVPMAVAAISVWSRPPEPRMLKNLGWTATACGLLGAALAVLGLW